MKQLKKLELNDVQLTQDEIKNILGGVATESGTTDAENSCGTSCQAGCSIDCQPGCKKGRQVG